ncbi:iron (metal) dependent repressor, DtxR family [Halogranum amylolyticum]|uniref:Manganese transport regulator n=1 Tax=Halogranum amylolyticum TaxID=660520 RepID=A0A1H8WL98_9EURY|nr:metal-dependent transcriptional regulator [Halogranum amylolyticum]SEP28464.1 iron (metal) dependent repressor, DtxR family [Halogranum amylolyticum]
MATPKVEDYLKTIHGIQDGDMRVAPSAIATAMGVKPPTVTTMLKRMHDDGLVDYERYQGARLTTSGENLALETLRHHRLLELFLTEHLGYDWSEVHHEADVLEHYISEKLEARIAALLGFPTVDPHGAPIPTVDLELRHDDGQQPIAQFDEGTLVVVSEVRDSSSDVLDYLAEVGVRLGALLEVIEIAPFGMITLGVRETGDQFSLPAETASNIFVTQFDATSTSESGQFSEVH